MANWASTRDFCCQSCGHRFTLPPKMRLWVFGIGSLVTCFPCVLPVVFGGITLAGWWPYNANPVAAGAEFPPIRFRDDEPLRRAASCGGAAGCHQATRTRSRGLPTGTDYAYACGSCRKTFKIASVGGHVVNALGATLCFFLGFGCLPAGILLWLMGAAVLLLSAFQIWAEVKNPLIAEALPDGG